jgi:hypothetical protein
MACSVCGCGDILQSAGGVPPMPGGFRFTLQTDYLTATAASDEDPELTESLIQRGVAGTLLYGPSKSISLIAIVSFVSKDWTLDGGPEPPESASPTGLGDVNVGVRYYLMKRTNVVERYRQFLAMNAGSTLPTGSDNTQVDGERIDQHAQLGTGAYGPYAGVSYVLEGNLWNVWATLTGSFNTTNSYDYRYGSAVRWGVGTQRLLITDLAVSVAAEGRYASKDVAEDEELLNTGGTVLDITPGVSWSPAAAFAVYARAQIPVLTDLYGEQTVGTTFQIGMQFQPQ